MKSYLLSLPYPPSVNRYWRHVGPRVLISREGRLFREKICALLDGVVDKPLEGNVSIWIQLWPPDKRRRDIDNTLKALLDALAYAGAYHDDSQIKHLSIDMHGPNDDGEAQVRITGAENGAA